MVAVIAAALDLGATVLHYRMDGELPALPDDAGRYDAAVVFFHDNVDQETLDAETLRRLEHAADLYRHGRIRHVICVGGARPWEGFYGAVLMGEELQRRSVPQERIVVETVSLDSVSNLEAAGALAMERGLHRLVLVSSATHLRRMTRWGGLPGREVALSASEGDERGVVAWPALWWTAHREWAALGIHAVLPADLYAGFVRLVRRVGL